MNSKMSPELKEEWIDALRSGDYDQGRNLLNNNGNFCCLGVLCEILVEKGVLEKKEGVEGDPRKAGYREASRPYNSFKSTTPSADLTDRLGITQIDVNTLIFFNDVTNLSFDQIADWIELNL